MGHVMLSHDTMGSSCVPCHDVTRNHTTSLHVMSYSFISTDEQSSHVCSVYNKGTTGLLRTAVGEGET